jgi:heme A synthase
MANDSSEKSWRVYLSPLRLSLLIVNAVCFGGLLVVLALGTPSGPLVVLTIATGLSLSAGFAGALVASRRVINQKHNEPKK